MSHGRQATFQNDHPTPLLGDHVLLDVRFNRQIPVKNEKHSKWKDKLSGGSSSSSLPKDTFVYTEF